MGERKVLNFYVSPDFDASIIPRQKRDRTKLIEVRTMLPFSMRCNTCGEYMYRGKKFNSRKEDMPGEDYMGIRKFRFYIKCSVCSAEITFCTDPKNSDYECESGALRNFEMWRENDKIVEEDEKDRIEEDKIDAMKALENRTLDSKVEMDVLDALDEIQAINQRHERVDTNSVLDSLFVRSASSAVDNTVLASGVTAADEELIKSIQFKTSVISNGISLSLDSSSEVVDTEDSTVQKGDHSLAEQVRRQMTQAASSDHAPTIAPKITFKRRSAGSTVKTASKKLKEDISEKISDKKTSVEVSVQIIEKLDNDRQVGLLGLAAYGSDDSD